jgi:hypothetical protein
VLAGVAFAVRWVTRRRAGRAADRSLVPVVAALALWIVLVFALLVWEPAMWRAHIAHLVVPLALLAALRPPPWPFLLAAAIVTVPLFVAGNGDILWPSGYSGADAALVHRLEQLPPGALVISDDPGWAWRAGHAPPPDFADTSYQRVEDGQITRASLVSAASAHDVCAVVSSSPLHFGRFDGLGTALAPLGYEPTRLGNRITLYERGCDPTGRTNAAAPPRRSPG